MTKKASVFHPEEADRIWYEVKAPPHLQHLEICDYATGTGLFDDPHIPFGHQSQAIRFADQHAPMKAIYLDGRIESYRIVPRKE